MKLKIIKNKSVLAICILTFIFGFIVSGCSKGNKWQKEYDAEIEQLLEKEQEFNRKEQLLKDSANEHLLLGQVAIKILDTYLKGDGKLAALKKCNNLNELKIAFFSAHYFLKTNLETHLKLLNKLNLDHLDLCNNKDRDLSERVKESLKRLINICDNLSSCVGECDPTLTKTLCKIQRYTTERDEELKSLYGLLYDFAFTRMPIYRSYEQKEDLYEQCITLFQSDYDKLLELYDKHSHSMLDVVTKEKLTAAQRYFIHFGWN